MITGQSQALNISNQSDLALLDVTYVDNLHNHEPDAGTESISSTGLETHLFISEQEQNSLMVQRWVEYSKYK